jgi:hypothetical protein
MRHFEIVFKGLSKSEPPEFPLRTATFFVRRGEARANAFIALIEEFGGRIVKTRDLRRFGGFSIDVEVPNAQIAADLLFAYCRSEKATRSCR